MLSSSCPPGPAPGSRASFPPAQPSHLRSATDPRYGGRPPAGRHAKTGRPRLGGSNPMHSSHPGEDPPQCPRCRAENRRGVQYCEECGAAMPAACPRCGAPTVAGKRFCGGCGAPLGTDAGLPPAPTAPQGENRQVTVLFCDMVGSTGLAERIGAEAMHRPAGAVPRHRRRGGASLRRHRERLSRRRHHGPGRRPPEPRGPRAAGGARSRWPCGDASRGSGPRWKCPAWSVLRSGWG